MTNNVADFESLRRGREAFGGGVPGLIYTPGLAFPGRGGVLWLHPGSAAASRDTA